MVKGLGDTETHGQKRNSGKKNKTKTLLQSIKLEKKSRHFIYFLWIHFHFFAIFSYDTYNEKKVSLFVQRLSESISTASVMLVIFKVKNVETKNL